MNKVQYAKFRKSPYFGRVRKAVWKRDKGKCRDCNKRGRDVHHTSYKFLGFELDHLDTVILLCRRCHDRRHGRLLHQRIFKFLFQ